jgi:hypothetical protein
MRHTTVRQALQHVADHPELDTDEVLVVHVHELVARTLFEIANTPMSGKRGAGHKANIARNMIFNRLVGRRSPGSHPATRKQTGVEFSDLTGELEQ